MLILYSPLPGANTGTAVYLMALLADLKARFGPSICDQVAIVVDGTVGEDQISHASSHGWTVKELGSFERGETDICVYFLASNPYHYFCYEQLATHSRGRCVSVIHDLTAGFFLQHMKDFIASPYLSLLDLAFSSSMGVRGAALARDFNNIHEIARFFIAAQGVTLAKSELIVTHSYYAKSKLVLENNLSRLSEDKIVVCNHPKPIEVGTPLSAPPAEPLTRRFSVGSFGYYSHAKRFPSIVEAWANFLMRRPEAQAGRLVLGGEIPKSERKQLLALCDRDCAKTIEMHGFVSEHELHAYMRSLDLLVTLRFPSCGETSGLVAHALRYNTPIALSEFAAFREEPAAFRISVDPCEEVEQLAKAFETTFDYWKRNIRPANTPPDWVGPKKELASHLGQLLLAEVTAPRRQINADASSIL